MRKFMLITNRYKDRESDTLKRNCLVHTTKRAAVLQSVSAMWRMITRKIFALSEIPADTECILVLGGDGTLNPRSNQGGGAADSADRCQPWDTGVSV